MEQELRELRYTEDGSPTIWSPLSGEHYHSTHGAIQESLHVYIDAGLEEWLRSQQSQGDEIAIDTTPPLILEIGLGTGLNVLLSYAWAEGHKLPIRYTAIEKFPLSMELIEALLCERWDLGERFGYSVSDGRAMLERILKHEHWIAGVYPLGEYVSFQALHCDLLDFDAWTSRIGEGVDVVYFDAFSPESQPELWTEEVFEQLYKLCHPSAVLVTYCAKGAVRRGLERAGFVVERIPGPPGKREMLRARR